MFAVCCWLVWFYCGFVISACLCFSGVVWFPAGFWLIWLTRVVLLMACVAIVLTGFVVFVCFCFTFGGCFLVALLGFVYCG